MIKYVNDYIDKIQDKWPDIPREELKYIVEHGFRRLTDVLLNDNKVRIDQGIQVTISAPKTSEFKKHDYGRSKLRYEHKFLGKEFDGYYYFGLPKHKWDNYRRRLENNQKIMFKDIFLHKIKDETYFSITHDYFFRVPYLTDVGYKFFRKSFSPKRVELIAYRDENKNIIELNGNSESNQECTG